jgi:hypothetical protein
VSVGRSHASSSCLCAALSLLLFACTYATAAPDPDKVDASLRAVAEAEPIVISDTLERLIAADQDDTEDREFAYWVIMQRGQPRTAAAAFARAACAGRVAELRGLNAGRFVREVETFGEMSHALDPTFRSGAAKRMVATLYVYAPASMVEHGDSETGLAMLEELVREWPDDVLHHLRLAEAYIELDDVAPSYPHLCFCLARQESLRPDDRALLSRLVREVDAPNCSTPSPPSE